VWTIGYGHTGPDVHAGLVITQERADQLFTIDIQRFSESIQRRLIKAPTSNQFGAMVSLAYNIGAGAFAASSVLRDFNDGNIEAAADAFRLWNKCDGEVVTDLVARREHERTLFLTP